MLEHLIDLGNEAGNIELRTVVLQKCSLPQQFVRFSVDPMIDALDAKQTSRATSRLMHAQRSCGLEIAPPVGAVLDLDEALGGRYRIKTYLLEADMLEGQDAENFTLQTMPAGEHAEMIAAGTVGDHQSALLELFQDLHQKGLAAAGDIYLFDELSYLTYANRDFSVRYAVSVKKAV